jgi:SynChlorMet cassette protein ScmC
MGGYGLTLADGTRWFLSTRESDLQFWFKRFVHNLRLKPADPKGAQQLLFLNADQLPSSEIEAFRESASVVDGSSAETDQWGWCDPNTLLLRAWHSAKNGDFICVFPNAKAQEAGLDILLMGEFLGPIYLQAILKGGLPFHAALAEFNGQGVLLAGAGGTGKSTCSRRLPSHWKSHCDDTSLVVRRPCGGYHAHPFPTWSDHFLHKLSTTWPVESHMPLSAIFFLEQADNDGVERLGPGAAAVRIQESVTQIMERWWNTMPRARRMRLTTATFDNACAMAQTIPAFLLRVRLGGNYWKQMEQALDRTIT